MPGLFYPILQYKLLIQNLQQILPSSGTPETISLLEVPQIVYPHAIKRNQSRSRILRFALLNIKERTGEPEPPYGALIRRRSSQGQAEF